MLILFLDLILSNVTSFSFFKWFFWDSYPYPTLWLSAEGRGGSSTMSFVAWLECLPPTSGAAAPHLQPHRTNLPSCGSSLKWGQDRSLSTTQHPHHSQHPQTGLWPISEPHQGYGRWNPLIHIPCRWHALTTTGGKWWAPSSVPHLHQQRTGERPEGGGQGSTETSQPPITEGKPWQFPSSFKVCWTP